MGQRDSAGIARAETDVSLREAREAVPGLSDDWAKGRLTFCIWLGSGGRGGAAGSCTSALRIIVVGAGRAHVVFDE